ncbi:MAG: peptide ABC transporter substrate-binding protein [Planctomycetota bacterium]
MSGRAAGAAALVLLMLLGGFALGGRSLRERADFAFCNQQELSSLDPAIATGTPEARILQALFEGLLRADPVTGSPLPGLAESWEVSPDGLNWTFQVRTDSQFSDGSRITAEDLEYSLRRVLDPATAAPYADLLWCVVGARAFSQGQGSAQAVAVRASSPTRLEMRLENPTPHLPAILAMAPFGTVQRACIERWGRAWVQAEHLVSSGSFRLVERRVRDRLRLARHEGYWGAADVALRTIDAYASEGVTTQLNMYLTGQVDWMIKPPTSLYSAILPRPDAVRGPQAGVTFLRFNVTRPPFDDPRVRRALALSLDREALARDVLRGGERPCRSFVPDVFPGYAPAELAVADVALARRLLAEAGYPGGAGFPDFELLFPNNELTRDFCEAVASQWSERLGVRPRLVNQAWKVYLDSSKNKLYDVAWGAWTADVFDPITFLGLFQTGVANNRTGWGSARYDELLAEAGRQVSAEARAALLAQAEAVLLAELPIAPLAERICLNLVAPRVHGFHHNPLDLHPLRDLSVSDRAP